MSTDPFDLEHFVSAQAGSYAAAVRELTAGRKTSHWMWFVFPQLAGLGTSAMAQRYALSGLPEAMAYLAHPVLGQRLLECAAIVAGLPTRDPVEVLGPVDAVKLRSSMTLFAAADPGQPAFPAVLERYFGGAGDAMTLGLLRPGD